MEAEEIKEEEEKPKIIFGLGDEIDESYLWE